MPVFDESAERFLQPLAESYYTKHTVGTRKLEAAEKHASMLRLATGHGGKPDFPFWKMVSQLAAVHSIPSVARVPGSDADKELIALSAASREQALVLHLKEAEPVLNVLQKDGSIDVAKKVFRAKAEALCLPLVSQAVEDEQGELASKFFETLIASPWTRLKKEMNDFWIKNCLSNAKEADQSKEKRRIVEETRKSLQRDLVQSSKTMDELFSEEAPSGFEQSPSRRP